MGKTVSQAYVKPLNLDGSIIFTMDTSVYSSVHITREHGPWTPVMARVVCTELMINTHMSLTYIDQ